MVPQKMKNRLLYDPATLLLGIHQKSQKQDLEEIFAHLFVTALFTLVKMWKPKLKCPLMDNQTWYIDNRILFRLKKEVLTPAITWMDIKEIMLIEISHKKTNTI